LTTWSVLRSVPSLRPAVSSNSQAAIALDSAGLDGEKLCANLVFDG
jgi:hypothetical protein